MSGEYGTNTTPLWNDLPVKVKEAKLLNGFKAGLNWQELLYNNAWGWWLDFIYTSILLNNLYIYSYHILTDAIALYLLM